MTRLLVVFFFFFNDTATTEIYTLSLHDALPICALLGACAVATRAHVEVWAAAMRGDWVTDRKSTRLNSSHSQISYAVFCLKKKKKYKHVICTTRNNTVRLCYLYWLAPSN